MYKKDLALSNPQGLICHKRQPKQPNQNSNKCLSLRVKEYY